MALTPEDVVNKRFQTTKFKEGYDQDDVDDFLDEVVLELRRLNQENEELRQRLASSEARVAELQAGASAAAEGMPQPVPAVSPEPSAPAPAAASPMQQPNSTQYPENSGLDFESSNINNLLQLARRLHEEHVREGMEKRDALIAEAQEQAASLVAQAEETSRSTLAALRAEKTELEAQVERLRGFESEYRRKLRGYIEEQLAELDVVSSISDASGEAGAATAESEPVGETAAPPVFTYSQPTPVEPPTEAFEPTGVSEPSETVRGRAAEMPEQAPPPAAPFSSSFPSSTRDLPVTAKDASVYQRPTQFPGFGGN